MIKNYSAWLNEAYLYGHILNGDEKPEDVIRSLLEYYNIKNYKIRSNGIVDVDGDVDIDDIDIYRFSIKFGTIKGDFSCNSCVNLESLEGVPEKCERFTCVGCCNNLKSLEGAPKECREFYCGFCENLESFKGAPEKCEKFDCSWCYKLEYSLEYFPKCKKVNVDDSCFINLYNTIGNDNFIKLINAKTDFEFENILAIGYSRGLDFKKYIKPLLKNKSTSEEVFKYKYRDIIFGEKINF